MAAKKKQITIVGAGLTGALLGLRLGQCGYKVDLFERRPQTSENVGDSGRSINLALSRRGIDALEMVGMMEKVSPLLIPCLLYTSPSPRDGLLSRMPSSA